MVTREGVLVGGKGGGGLGYLINSRYRTDVRRVGEGGYCCRLLSYRHSSLR